MKYLAFSHRLARNIKKDNINVEIIIHLFVKVLVVFLVHTILKDAMIQSQAPALKLSLIMGIFSSPYILQAGISIYKKRMTRFYEDMAIFILFSSILLNSGNKFTAQRLFLIVFGELMHNLIHVLINTLTSFIVGE
ncbi:Hypothetical_protein [Hexamita inflata]|uniref:Hypothetical_protein n=1 Tax=Hexamita inflata TaxID=28002 RepID=A0ABP1H8J4_9EUKA